jgi:hypothetical protein
MNYRKTLAAFAAVAGLMCANSGYATSNVVAKTEKESSIAVLLSALFSAKTDSKKLGINAEPPACYAKSGSKTAPDNNRCGEDTREEADPCKLKPNGPGCSRDGKPQPCDGRYCPEPEPGDI